MKVNLSQSTMQQVENQIIHEKSHTLIGYMKDLGLRYLHEWATRVFHILYFSITMLGNGYFYL